MPEETWEEKDGKTEEKRQREGGKGKGAYCPETTAEIEKE